MVISLFASYFVAMTVIPLFCSRFLKGFHHSEDRAREAVDSTGGSTAGSPRLLDLYERWVRARSAPSGFHGCWLLTGVFVASLAIYPLLGVAFFPQTDAGQFTSI